jgi:hypothetical protein
MQASFLIGSPKYARVLLILLPRSEKKACYFLAKELDSDSLAEDRLRANAPSGEAAPKLRNSQSLISQACFLPDDTLRSAYLLKLDSLAGFRGQ